MVKFSGDRQGFGEKKYCGAEDDRVKESDPQFGKILKEIRNLVNQGVVVRWKDMTCCREGDVKEEKKDAVFDKVQRGVRS